MILPYYRIERTEEGKQFFFSHKGYFNFWDKYLIMHIKGYSIFSVLVNRPGTEFHGEITEDYRVVRYLYLKQSVSQRKPEEMFEDFPELLEERNCNDRF